MIPKCIRRAFEVLLESHNWYTIVPSGWSYNPQNPYESMKSIQIKCVCGAEYIGDEAWYREVFYDMNKSYSAGDVIDALTFSPSDTLEVVINALLDNIE